jgi:hypothetical protein
MPEGLSPDVLNLKRVFQTLRANLNPSAIKALVADEKGDRGHERYRRASVTAGASFIAKALTLLISFVSVPLTVHYLGAERYGVWLTISSLLIWMQISDFGLAGNALINVLSGGGAELYGFRFLGARGDCRHAGRCFPVYV